MSNKLFDLIESSGAKWVDFRFTDTHGKELHLTFPASTVDEDTLEDGKMFDGSSVAGWKGIESSDMILLPDAKTAYLDPFYESPTVVVSCDVIEPATMQGYEKTPAQLHAVPKLILNQQGLAIRLILALSLNFLFLMM